LCQNRPIGKETLLVESDGLQVSQLKGTAMKSGLYEISLLLAYYYWYWRLVYTRHSFPDSRTSMYAVKLKVSQYAFHGFLSDIQDKIMYGLAENSRGW
jgi:hypothetical protein